MDFAQATVSTADPPATSFSLPSLSAKSSAVANLSLAGAGDLRPGDEALAHRRRVAHDVMLARKHVPRDACGRKASGGVDESTDQSCVNEATMLEEVG